MIGYNRVCRVSDFADLRGDILSIYGMDPVSAEFRKHWEVGMSARGLRDFGALHDRARLLGVGAGTERTSFWLTQYAEQVFATDLYYEDGWPEWADHRMLVDPSPWAGAAWNPQRMVVQHMDGRTLRYPDAFFDGIYSASSIEHFGTLDDVAQSAAEMGRVLKPGGVIALTTEWRISGTEGNGWGNVIVFNEDTLNRYVIEPTGCELVDAPDYGMDAETVATGIDLDRVLALSKQKQPIPTPHVALCYAGYLFTSVSVTLRKPA